MACFLTRLKFFFFMLSSVNHFITHKDPNSLKVLFIHLKGQCHEMNNFFELPPVTRLAATQSELGAIQPLKLPTINHPPLMKSNTVTRFKTISCLRNSLQNHKRVPVCRNKQFEEGYWTDFYN
jgi:hypothetical protein